jgi:hypothetical protein
MRFHELLALQANLAEHIFNVAQEAQLKHETAIKKAQSEASSKTVQ